MIYTITLNPSIDYYAYLDSLKVGDINRLQDYHFIAAGKGLNVSRMLSKLNVPSVCVFPKGGFTGAFLEQEIAQDENIDCRTVFIEQPNRINVKIRHGQETDLNAAGPELTTEIQDQLLRVIETISNEDYIVISGAIQKGLYPLIQRFAEMIKVKGAKLVLDIPNLSLQQIVLCQPFLIKPNLEELQTLLQLDKPLEELLEPMKKQILESGVERILISLGDQGAFYIDRKVSYRIYTAQVPVVNTVAAGDSLLAAALAALVQGEKWMEVLKRAVATGTAAVTVEYLPEMEDIERVYSGVYIELFQ